MDRVLISILYIILFVIVFIDIKNRYIPNFLNFSVFIISIFIKSMENFTDFFIGSGIFILPIVLFYGYASDIFKREVIGFGDVKLIAGLGGLVYSSHFNIYLQIYFFYSIIFMSAGLFILFLLIYKYYFYKSFNLKNYEIPLAPFICLSFLSLQYFSNFIYRIFIC